MAQAFVGANSYVSRVCDAFLLLQSHSIQWLPLLTSNEDVEATFQEMEDAGVKVLRTWASVIPCNVV